MSTNMTSIIGIQTGSVIREFRNRNVRKPPSPRVVKLMTVCMCSVEVKIHKQTCYMFYWAASKCLSC